MVSKDFNIKDFSYGENSEGEGKFGNKGQSCIITYREFSSYIICYRKIVTDIYSLTYLFLDNAGMFESQN